MNLISHLSQSLTQTSFVSSPYQQCSTENHHQTFETADNILIARFIKDVVSNETLHQLDCRLSDILCNFVLMLFTSFSTTASKLLPSFPNKDNLQQLTGSLSVLLQHILSALESQQLFSMTPVQLCETLYKIQDTLNLL